MSFTIPLEKLDASVEKSEIVMLLRQQIADLHLSIEDENIGKPWGAYFRFSDDSIEAFAKEFYPEREINPTEASISPKILLVAPGAELSWQYHHRRSEIWKVYFNPVGVMLNDSDEISTVQTYIPGQTIIIGQGERHRIIGLENWTIIAEIWQHKDPANPSNEEDIVRLVDKYGREGSNENK
jgi:mannose-6-phosphate isomerase-like protein (cupin superfamily)